jgi:hypothetical protein
VTEPNPDDLEDLQLLRLKRFELEAALAAGEFKLISWAAVVTLALRYIDKEL